MNEAGRRFKNWTDEDQMKDFMLSLVLWSSVLNQLFVKPTLAYDDLFSHSPDEDGSVPEVEGDDDDDMFAASANTASGLFGHCTKSPGKYRQ